MRRDERIEELRARIAENDRTIVSGVNERLRLVTELWRLKEEHGAPRLDPDRERRLQDELLAPVLKIADVRTDTRIEFVGGARGTSELERLVDSRHAAVAFSLYPVSVDDLIAVSDAGAIMPPKSTWFEPKLRDGLLIHLI